jgi:hypothetical protein
VSAQSQGGRRGSGGSEGNEDTAELLLLLLLPLPLRRIPKWRASKSTRAPSAQRLDEYCLNKAGRLVASFAAAASAKASQMAKFDPLARCGVTGWAASPSTAKLKTPLAMVAAVDPAASFETGFLPSTVASFSFTASVAAATVECTKDESGTRKS